LAEDHVSAAVTQEVNFARLVVRQLIRAILSCEESEAQHVTQPGEGRQEHALCKDVR